MIPIVVKIWSTQFQISQQRLGISTPRKTEQVEWGTSIYNASKYTPVAPFVTMAYVPTYPPLTQQLFLDFSVFSFKVAHQLEFVVSLDRAAAVKNLSTHFERKDRVVKK